MSNEDQLEHADVVIDQQRDALDRERARAENAEAELREIDNLLSRRDAIDHLPDRQSKIRKALEIAATKDPQNELGKLRDAAQNLLTVWDGAHITQKQPVFADAVRQLREGLV